MLFRPTPSDPIETHVYLWKAARAIRQGWVDANEETREDAILEADEMRRSGRPWLSVGFDLSDTAEVLSALSHAGLQTGESDFRDLAEDALGPHEIAEAWAQRANIPKTTPEWTVLWLAARRLWEIWLPGRPTLEGEADLIERAMQAERAGGTPEDALEAIERLAEAVEGSAQVLNAISDELPLSVHAWICTVIERAKPGPSGSTRWIQVAKQLMPAYGEDYPLLTSIAVHLLHNGETEQAAEVAEGLFRDAVVETRFRRYTLKAAKLLAALNEGAKASTLCEQALLLAANDEHDDLAAQATLAVFSTLGQAGDAQEFIRRVRVKRSMQDRRGRRDRRRADKKGPRRR